METNFIITIKGENYNITETINKTQLSTILPIILGLVSYSKSASPPNQGNSYKKIRRSSTVRHSTSPVAIRPEIENLHIEPVSQRFGNYWSLSKKGDRLLWILANLSEMNFESANQKELSLIAKKLTDNIPTKHISAFFDSHKKQGRVAPSLEGSIRMVRILKPGLDYIAELSGGGSGRLASPSTPHVG